MQCMVHKSTVATHAMYDSQIISGCKYITVHKNILAMHLLHGSQIVSGYANVLWFTDYLWLRIPTKVLNNIVAIHS